MKKYVFRPAVFLTATAIFWLMQPARIFAQTVSVVTLRSHQTFQLPDPAAIQSAADGQAAVASAETAAKALITDATSLLSEVTAGQSNLTKAQTQQSDYVNAVNSFSKNDVEPYKANLNGYTALGTKYTDLLNKHNKAVLANNALAAKDRKAATVAALSKEKIQIDTMAAQLTHWKIKLDAAKAKLDVKNAALQKQQQNYQAAETTATTKLKSLRPILSRLSDQLNTCESYAGKYHDVLFKKFNTGTAGENGYFGTPDYKTSSAGLKTQLMKLNSLP
jgi:bisphosphoglycerate-dependent phosphoglycerate mutase